MLSTNGSGQEERLWKTGNCCQEENASWPDTYDILRLQKVDTPFLDERKPEFDENLTAPILYIHVAMVHGGMSKTRSAAEAAC